EVPNMDAIASRFLAPEANRVAALPAERRLEEFFTCWTGTEAFLKATGGIGADLDLQRKVPSPLSSDWRLHPLLPAPGYVGALAYRHDEARVSLWRVSGATVAARAITV